MESKEYFEKVMQDYNQHRNGRSLRKYCKDEAIDYDWVIKFKKTYPVRSTEKEEPAEGFVPLAVTEEPVPSLEWSVEHLVLRSPKVMSLRLRVRVCLSWQNCCIRCHRLCFTSLTGQSISLIPIRQICVKDVRDLQTL